MMIPTAWMSRKSYFVSYNPAEESAGVREEHGVGPPGRHLPGNLSHSGGVRNGERLAEPQPPHSAIAAATANNEE